MAKDGITKKASKKLAAKTMEEPRIVVPVVVDEVEELPVKVGVKLRGFRGVRKAVRRRSRTGA